jgi:hypothetical protein
MTPNHRHVPIASIIDHECETIEHEAREARSKVRTRPFVTRSLAQKKKSTGAHDKQPAGRMLTVLV